MYIVIESFNFYDNIKNKRIIFPIGSKINYNRKNNKITIYYLDVNNFTCVEGNDFDIEEYLEPIEENNEDNQTKTELIENKSVKHLHVLQFDNLLVMNKELEKISEDEVVSIRPVTITNMNNENTIYYIVVVRR